MKILFLYLFLFLGACQQKAEIESAPIYRATQDSTSAHHGFIFHGEKPDSLDFIHQSQVMDSAVAQFNADFNVVENNKITVEVYPSYEAKALATKDQACTSVPQAQKIIVVWSKENKFNCLDGAGSIESRLMQYYPNPSLPVLQKGIGLYYTQNWRFKGFKHWAAKLYAAGFAPNLENILTEIPIEENPFAGRTQQQSPLIQQVMSGVLVDFLIQKMGKSAFIRQYPTLKKSDIINYKTEFETYLSELPTQSGTPIPTPLKIQKGFNFAHEGYNIVDGYMGSSAVKAIDKMDSLGVNALALVPYSFMRNPKIPHPFPIFHGAGGENDESVIFSALTARKHGMTLMLKPQIWIRNSWPGAVVFDNTEQEALFFIYYEKWIAHYALLAEMYEMEIFCVATEFGKMTKGHEDKWIALFNKIRKIYSGKMTVAAHWQGDFEHKAFWQALDYVGINLYKSLSEKENPTDEKLYQGALTLTELVKKQAKTFERPVLLTETGFTATSQSWKNPFEYADGKDLNIEHQKRAYSAFLKAMIEEKAVEGIYLWKYPTVLSYGGENNNDFTPNGKPAEAIVHEWYKKWN